MTADERNLTLQNAILEWQKKYGIRDGDPLLASLELFQIYLTSLYEVGTKPHGDSAPSFGEFRESMEFLDRRCKQLTKLVQEFSERSHQSLPTKHSSHIGWWLTMLLVSVVIGIVIGRWYL